MENAGFEHVAPWENPSTALHEEDPLSAKRTLEDVMDDEDDDDDDFEDVKVVKKPRVVDNVEIVQGNVDVPQLSSHDRLHAVEAKENDITASHDVASTRSGGAIATGLQICGDTTFEAVTPEDDVPDTSTDVDQVTTAPVTTASEMDPFESVASDSDNHHEYPDERYHQHDSTAPSGRSAVDVLLQGVVDGTSPSAPSSVSSVEAVDTWSTTASEGADGPPAVIDDSVLLSEQPSEEQRGQPSSVVSNTSDYHVADTMSPSASTSSAASKEQRSDLADQPHDGEVVDSVAALPSPLDNQSIGDLNDMTVESAVTVLEAPQQQLASDTAREDTRTQAQAFVAEHQPQPTHATGTSTAAPAPSTDHSTHTAAGTSSSTSGAPPAAPLAREPSNNSTSTGSRWGSRPTGTTAHGTTPDTGVATLSDVIWTRLLDFQHTNHIHHADFSLSQLRPATLDMLATWPEFAQLAMVARFTRAAAALQTAGNKDSLLAQTIQEYEAENPTVRQLVRLPPSEVTSQEGHFSFGYAPPQPSTGMVPNPPRRSYNVAVELSQHKDKFLLDEFGRVKTAAMATATVPATVAATTAAAHVTSAPSGASTNARPANHGGRHQAPVSQGYNTGGPRGGRSPPRRYQGRSRSRSRSRDRRPPPQPHHHHVDRYQDRYNPQHAPRPHHHEQPQQYNSHQQQQRFLPPQQHHVPPSYQGPPPQQHYPPSSHHGGHQQPSYQQRSQPYEPPPSSYRQEYPPHSYPDRGGDPNSRQYAPPHQPPPHHPHQQNHRGPPPSQRSYGGAPPPSSSQNLVEDFRRSEIFHRLPLSIRDALQALYAKGQVRELLNDSVLSRLVKLPEHLAVRAVENLTNTDSSHVDNIHGFFVGIISRVYERDRGPPPTANLPPLGGPHGGDPRAEYSSGASDPRLRGSDVRGQHQGMNQQAGMWSQNPVHDQLIRALSPQVLAQLQHMASTGVMSSVDEWGEKCYEILGQLSESLAIEVLKRFTMANLDSVRNRSGFLIGVVKRCRQEYGLPP
ncbi:hypothetical protein H310_11257 [Aphanomyces invadans]|uniref:Heterogeneous nuclear ribonucleoprotein Q acidic domain-containing protein n=1 Tax=Aphanomyces invadans TaxID=157072 RepID=A0A024TPW6_9STRA|nr:hypothetical protein H310_11257 [Aphanomyces invadans]ETV95372.1 hypothetical protein H310_11257 [Aphanomyces invadans]|eukprot:XP_008876073.1 hypothetical protein H310_11257 [Aphanomyces invadans]